MAQLLFIIAIFLIGYAMFAPLLGVIPFTFVGLISNVIFAILFIALANILNNQSEIIDKLDYLEGGQRKQATEKKECTRCNYNYDIDYRSCPKCGNSEG